MILMPKIMIQVKIKWFYITLKMYPKLVSEWLHTYLSFFLRRKSLEDKGTEVDSIVSYLQKDIWSIMPQILYRETREVWIRSSSFNIDTKLTKENQTHKAISYCIVYRDFIKLKSIHLWILLINEKQSWFMVGKKYSKWL